MNQANVYALQAAALYTRSLAPSAGSTIESNSPGPAVPFDGVVSSPRGDALVVGLLLICLFAAAILTPFEVLMPQERSGKRSKPSTICASTKGTGSGGTAKEHYE